MGLEENDKLVCASEYISDRLYFVTLRSPVQLKSTSRTHFFSIDDKLTYVNFHLDFGPLNLAMLYRYCRMLNHLLEAPCYAKKKIVHYTVMNCAKRANAAFLIASYAVIYLNRTPEEAYRPLTGDKQVPLQDFRDAGFGPSLFSLTLLDCLRGLHKAKKFRFFDFDDFEVDEYEFCERVETLDLNWIIPEKFLAFCGPHSRETISHDYIVHSPETYLPYFRSHGVSTVVRLNRRMYDAASFTRAGLQHHDLFFVDGSTPSAAIMQRFIEIAEQSSGAVAVHCKAGLGRTGSLICCYMMKHYRMTAAECIGWLRVCRPGSVLGHQQQWLLQQQRHLLALPLTTSSSGGGGGASLVAPQRCRFGVYSRRHQTAVVTSGATDAQSALNTGCVVSGKLSSGVGSLRLTETANSAGNNNNNNSTDTSVDSDVQSSGSGGDSDSDCCTDHNVQVGGVLDMPVLVGGGGGGTELSQGDRLNRIKALRQNARATRLSPAAAAAAAVDGDEPVCRLSQRKCAAASRNRHRVAPSTGTKLAPGASSAGARVSTRVGEPVDKTTRGQRMAHGTEVVGRRSTGASILR